MTAPITFNDASARREWFRTACDLVGGNRAMAAALEVSERAVSYWLDGNRSIGDGVIADAVRALHARADACLAAAGHPPP